MASQEFIFGPKSKNRFQNHWPEAPRKICYYLDGFSDCAPWDDVVVEFAPLSVAVWVDEDDVVAPVVVARVDQDSVQDIEAKVVPTPSHRVFAVNLHRFDTYDTNIGNILTIADQIIERKFDFFDLMGLYHFILSYFLDFRVFSP